MAKKAEAQSTQKIIAWICLLSAGAFTVLTAADLASYSANSNYGDLWGLMPQEAKIVLGIALVTGVWSWAKSGRLKLLVAAAFGMLAASGFTWKYLLTLNVG